MFDLIDICNNAKKDFDGVPPISSGRVGREAGRGRTGGVRRALVEKLNEKSKGN